jgi:WD40 repeat protein
MQTLQGHRGPVLSLAYAPDGRTLASGDADQQVRLWDVQTGADRATFQVPAPKHRRPGIHSLAFHPDGQTLAAAAAGSTVALWDVERLKPLRGLAGHELPARSVAFAPDGSPVTGGRNESANRGEVLVWDSARGRAAFGLWLDSAWLHALAVAPDGRTVALGTSAGLFLWEPRGGPSGVRVDELALDRIRTGGGLVSGAAAPRPYLRGMPFIGEATAVAYSADGRLLAAAEGRAVGLWAALELRRVARLEGHQGPVRAVAFSPDGRTAASASQDGALRLWNMPGRSEVACLDPREGPLSAVAFAPDGMTVAVAAGDEVIIWDVGEAY